MFPDVPLWPSLCRATRRSSFTVSAHHGNTPAEIVDKLNKEIHAGLADSKLEARLAELGGAPAPMTPAEFGKHIAEETEKWNKVIRAVGIRAG